MIQRLFHPSLSASSLSVPRVVKRPTGTQPYMGVQVLVLSPTRELALQTQSVARSLCTSSSWGTLSVVGGTSFSTDQKRLQTERADVLFAVRPSTHPMLLLHPATHLCLIYLSLRYTADTRPAPRPTPEWRSRTAAFKSSMLDP